MASRYVAPRRRTGNVPGDDRCCVAKSEIEIDEDLRTGCWRPGPQENHHVVRYTDGSDVMMTEGSTLERSQRTAWGRKVRHAAAAVRSAVSIRH